MGMKPEIKSKWLSALRSGDYKQVDGQLNKGDEGFCCLGVLCEIAVQDGVIEKLPPIENADLSFHDPGSVGYRSVGDNNRPYTEYDILPEEVMVWAGLDSRNPPVQFRWDKDDDPNTFPISDLNDDKRLKFPEIADVIEEQL